MTTRPTLWGRLLWRLESEGKTTVLPSGCEVLGGLGVANTH